MQSVLTFYLIGERGGEICVHIVAFLLVLYKG